MGNYVWGTTAARFALGVPATSKTLPELLAGLIVGAAPWKTNAEFRQTTGILHETVHYLQDLLTGVGYADMLVQRRYVPILLGHTRNLTWFSPPPPPYGGIPGPAGSIKASDRAARTEIAAIRREARSLVQDLLYVPNELLPRSRRVQIRDAAQLLTGRRVTLDGVQSLTVESLLEGEAAATTFLPMGTFRRSEFQGEIAEQQAALYDLGAMEPRYTHTFYIVLTFLRNELLTAA